RHTWVNVQRARGIERLSSARQHPAPAGLRLRAPAGVSYPRKGCVHVTTRWRPSSDPPCWVTRTSVHGADPADGVLRLQRWKEKSAVPRPFTTRWPGGVALGLGASILLAVATVEPLAAADPGADGNCATTAASTFGWGEPNRSDD